MSFNFMAAITICSDFGAQKNNDIMELIILIQTVCFGVRTNTPITELKVCSHIYGHSIYDKDGTAIHRE